MFVMQTLVATHNKDVSFIQIYYSKYTMITMAHSKQTTNRKGKKKKSAIRFTDTQPMTHTTSECSKTNKFNTICTPTLHFIWIQREDYEQWNVSSTRCKAVWSTHELHTLPHELIDIGRTASRTFHSVSSLQQMIDFSQIDAGIRRHAVRCQLPQQNTERCTDTGSRYSMHTSQQIPTFISITCEQFDAKNICGQECQALLNAKYCPRVAQCWMSDKYHIFDLGGVCDLCLRVCVFNRLLQGIMPVQHFVIQANWFTQYHAHPKHKKPRDLDLRPMTLIFNRLLEVVKIRTCSWKISSS